MQWKPFIWKFSATSHGKGVVDGVRGKVKSTVRRKVMSKGKDSLVVQDCESFVQAAKKLMKRDFFTGDFSTGWCESDGE